MALSKKSMAQLKRVQKAHGFENLDMAVDYLNQLDIEADADSGAFNYGKKR